MCFAFITSSLLHISISVYLCFFFNMCYECCKTQASLYTCTGAITAARGDHYPRHQLHRYCPRTTKHPVCPLRVRYSQSLHFCVRVIPAYLRIRVRWPSHLCRQHWQHRIGPFVTNCLSGTICQVIIQTWRVAQGSFSLFDAGLSCNCLRILLRLIFCLFICFSTHQP